MPAQKPTAIFSALPLRGRSRTDTSPVRTGRKAASSKNPALIFAREPGKIQTKASTPRPADGGHREAFKGRALWGGGGGETSGGKRGKGFRGNRKEGAKWNAGGGRGGGGGAGSSPRTDTDKHGQTRTNTDRGAGAEQGPVGEGGKGSGKAPKGGRRFFLNPGTLWRGQRSEVGGQGEPNGGVRT